MSGDQNQNQNQNQNKQKQGGGAKDGVSISQTWSATNPGSIPAQMKGAFINGMAYAFVPLVGGLLAKMFDAVGQRFFHVKPVQPTGPAISGNIMAELHAAAAANPEDAKRAINSVAKRLGMQVAPAGAQPGQVLPAAPLVATPAPAPVVPAATDTVPSPAAMEVTKPVQEVPHVNTKPSTNNQPKKGK